MFLNINNYRSEKLKIQFRKFLEISIMKKSKSSIEPSVPVVLIVQLKIGKIVIYL